MKNIIITLSIVITLNFCLYCPYAAQNHRILHHVAFTYWLKSQNTSTCIAWNSRLLCHVVFIHSLKPRNNLPCTICILFETTGYFAMYHSHTAWNHKILYHVAITHCLKSQNIFLFSSHSRFPIIFSHNLMSTLEYEPSVT